MPTTDELRAMVFTDPGDSKIMRFPDGTTALTGYTAEAGMDDQERRQYERSLQHLYQQWANGEGRQQDPSKPAIYCFLNGGSPEWWNVSAVAEDGEGLAGHVCSSPVFFKHDLGLTSDWKHDKYREKYPEGYRLVWVERDDLVNRTAAPEALKAVYGDA
jgi:hypothetical protein